MTIKALSPRELGALSDDDLIAYIEELTSVIDAAPVAQPARVDAHIAGRMRTPPVPVRVLAAASGGMTTSGVINGIRQKRKREHEAGLHKHGGVILCRECAEEAEV